MNFFITILAMVSGALLAALICKAVRLRLWIDILAGVGGGCGSWAALALAGRSAWPIFWIATGFAAVVVFLRLKHFEERQAERGRT